MRFVQRIIFICGLVILFIITIYFRSNENIDLHDTLTEKYTVPSVDETLWTENFDERKIVKFKMDFKNKKMEYYFHRYDFNQNKCDGVELLIIIFSRPEAIHGRMALRNSWLKNNPSSVLHRFIIGSTWNKSTRKSNEAEALHFSDLIITNIRDTYLNGTFKAYALLQWEQHFCPNAKYLLKADDDVVVNIPRLLYWIKKDFDSISKNNNGRTIFCKVLKNGKPLRNPNKKWYLSTEMYNKSSFPDYCSGATYLMTSEAVKALITETPKHNFLHIEDVFFPGIIAEAAGVKLIDKCKNFGYGNKINSKFGCDEQGVPFLSTIYENGNEDVIYRKGLKNKFDISTEKLFNLSCKWWHAFFNIFE